MLQKKTLFTADIEFWNGKKTQLLLPTDSTTLKKFDEWWVTSLHTSGGEAITVRPRQRHNDLKEVNNTLLWLHSYIKTELERSAPEFVYKVNILTKHECMDIAAALDRSRKFTMFFNVTDFRDVFLPESMYQIYTALLMYNNLGTINKEERRQWIESGRPSKRLLHFLLSNCGCTYIDNNFLIPNTVAFLFRGQPNQEDLKKEWMYQYIMTDINFHKEVLKNG